jgi:hypothetical protein
MAKVSAPKLDTTWAKTVTLRFGADSGIDPPDGFKDLQIGDEVNVEITGKITQLSQSDGSSSFEVEMKEVELETPEVEAAEEEKEPAEDEKGKSIGDTLKKLGK